MIRVLSRAALLALLTPLACSTTGGSAAAEGKTAKESTQDSHQNAPRHRAQIVLENEAAIEDLRGPIGELGRSIQNLALPDARARSVFAERVEVVDLAGSSGTEQAVLNLDARASSRGLGRRVVRSGRSLTLWTPFLKDVDYFERASFYTIRGSFDPQLPNVFRSPSGFKGTARMQDGSLSWIRAKIHMDWRRLGATDWKLETFRMGSFDITRSPATLYDDVTNVALSATDLASAQRSLRDEFLIKWVRGIRSGEVDLDKFMSGLLASLGEGTTYGNWGHIAVVDFDRDGWDDIYLLPFDATALFFRNRGNGTFEEIGSRIGLGLDGVLGALFADFDNDDDDDVVLTFYPGQTKILKNTKGRFEVEQEGLPGLALALSVVDYDGDGLLDLYLGRYNGNNIGALGAALECARQSGREGKLKFPGMTEDESRELAKRLDGDGEPFVNIPGPPNTLLRNVGGLRFERAKNCAAAEPYYQTMAVAWSDIDLDGDMDLYAVNEGGPNQLVRNDGGGRFVDITDKATRDVGFGMGVSFGDYNEDGRQDIYVTNMYSKAGQRVAADMRSDPRVVSSARGNSLLRNTGSGFELLAGSDVEAADFGWGGIFCDPNNDGTLDVYAPAGYVTMPREVAAVGDS